MADRGDINERVATLESTVEDLREEKKLTRTKLHRNDQKLTAHTLDLDWMRPVVERLDRAHQRLMGVAIACSALGGIMGMALSRLFHIGGTQ